MNRSVLHTIACALYIVSSTTQIKGDGFGNILPSVQELKIATIAFTGICFAGGWATKSVYDNFKKKSSSTETILTDESEEETYQNQQLLLAALIGTGAGYLFHSSIHYCHNSN